MNLAGAGLYLLAAAVSRPAELGQARALMRGLRVPGERKIHFKHERDTIQKDIAAGLVSAELRTRVYLGHGRAEAVRELCLRALVIELADMGMCRLVLDSRGHDGDQSDRRIIHLALAATTLASDAVAYEHLRSHEEPALWIADAVAWCYGAGGDWRRRISPIVEGVADLGSRCRRGRQSGR